MYVVGCARPETFDETFRATNVPENVDAYLAKAFTLEKLEQELATTDSFFYFAYVNDELDGYFYKGLGFVLHGAHSFYLGDEEQTDLIMIKSLAE